MYTYKLNQATTTMPTYSCLWHTSPIYCGCWRPKFYDQNYKQHNIKWWLIFSFTTVHTSIKLSIIKINLNHSIIHRHQVTGFISWIQFLKTTLIMIHLSSSFLVLIYISQWFMYTIGLDFLFLIFSPTVLCHAYMHESFEHPTEILSN